jgi:hypothetical protein
MGSSSKVQAALCVRKALQGVMVLRAAALGMALSAGLAGCTGAGGDADDAPAGARPAPATSTAAASSTSSAGSAAAPTPTDTHNVLVMGDSLSAAYNLAAEQGWVALLDARMRTEAPPAVVSPLIEALTIRKPGASVRMRASSSATQPCSAARL